MSNREKKRQEIDESQHCARCSITFKAAAGWKVCPYCGAPLDKASIK